MSVDLRFPNITAQDPQGQMVQMKSYMHQLVQELNWALSTTDQRAAEAATAKISSGAGEAGGSSGKSPAETFASIKSLIIKSADIVEAYYQTINQKLEGLYVAQSTFGTFAEKTAQDITANSTNINQSFENIQQLEVNVGDLSDELIGVDSQFTEGLNSTNQNVSALQQGQEKLGEDLAATADNLSRIEKVIIGVNAYINSGLLYYEEGTAIPVYGIEVGQRTEVNGVETFNKYARFTANKLSFYDSNDNEVAYVSDYKLYITNVEITGSLRIGALVSTVRSDGSVIKKYVR